MSEQPPTGELPEERRKEIFRALVDAQDLHEFTAAQARQLVAKRFGIGERQVKEIDREGTKLFWQPL